MSLLNASLVTQLIPALQKSINMALGMDPGARDRLRPLAGCILEIHISSLDHSFYFRTENEEVVMLPNADQVSIRLSGSALAFVKLATYRDKNNLFRTREINLSGDAVRAQQIQRFARDLNIDWEALLAEFIGDVPAHALGSSLRSSLNWGRQFSQNFKQDLEEFIKYELRLFPGKALAKHQFENIDQLRLATDRLEARVKKLIKRAGSH